MVNAYGSTASIEANSNEIYSTTEGKWGLIPEGSLIKFADDHGFYTINYVKEVFYIEKFKKHGKTSVRVFQNVGFNVLPGDTTTLSSKQHKLIRATVLDGGKGFKEGDVVAIDGGRASVNASNGTIDHALLKVIETTKEGSVLELNTSQEGNYLALPNSTHDASFGSATGLKIKLFFEESPERHLVEMIVNRVTRNTTDSIVHFDSLLPTTMEDGKIATKKYHALLSSQYYGKKKYVDTYEIITNFTPYLKMPLLAKHSLSPETFFNRSLIILDERIKNLEEKLNLR